MLSRETFPFQIFWEYPPSNIVLWTIKKFWHLIRSYILSTKITSENEGLVSVAAQKGDEQTDPVGQ